MGREIGPVVEPDPADILLPDIAGKPGPVHPDPAVGGAEVEPPRVLPTGILVGGVDVAIGPEKVSRESGKSRY